MHPCAKSVYFEWIKMVTVRTWCVIFWPFVPLISPSRLTGGGRWTIFSWAAASVSAQRSLWAGLRGICPSDRHAVQVRSTVALCIHADTRSEHHWRLAVTPLSPRAVLIWPPYVRLPVTINLQAAEGSCVDFRGLSRHPDFLQANLIRNA